MSASPSNSRYCFRNAEATSSGLGLAQSFWALSQRDQTVAQALEEACSEGFEYFEVGLREERLADTRALLKQFPLKLIAQGWVVSAEEANVFLERAMELGAIAINMHLGHAYMSTTEAVDLIAEVQRKADSHGIPLLVETHRGRLTQDLLRTVEVLRQLPEIAITLDVSHYLVAGEMLGGSSELFHAHTAPLLARAALIHGRISNGQSVQVSTNDSFAFTEVMRSLWQGAMELWLKDAPKDAVFIFEPELGPPPYAYLNFDGTETFDRAAESKILTRIARELWAAAQSKVTADDSA